MDNNRNITSIIFDVGGVLIGYRWRELVFEDLGHKGVEAEEAGAILFQDPIWKEFDRGHQTYDYLMHYYADTYPVYGSIITDLLRHPDGMAVKRPRVWDRVAELRQKGYKTYILSNYSEYLYRLHTADCPVVHEADGAVVSYMTGTLKPEREIYETLLERYSLNPKECVFFDDIQENVDAAKACGIDARRVLSEEQLLELLSEL